MKNSPFEVATLAFFLLAAGLPSLAQEQSLGDLAREARKSHPAQPARVYTNEDIPQATNEVVWRSAAMQPAEAPAVTVQASTAPAAPAAIKMRNDDVECNFSFRAEPLLPHHKAEPAGLMAMPASELAKLDGTASIWGETFDVSIHNDTGWALREVTVRVLIGGESEERRPTHTRPASHGVTAIAAVNDPTLALRVLAEPHTAAISSEPLGQTLNGQDWSWEIVQAKGIPPK